MAMSFIAKVKMATRRLRHAWIVKGAPLLDDDDMKNQDNQFVVASTQLGEHFGRNW